MTILEIIFWALIGIIVYVYLGYGALVIALAKVKSRIYSCCRERLSEYEPSVTVVIPAFNEDVWLKRKIENSLALNYPQDKLKILVVTDGPDGGMAKMLQGFPAVRHNHEPERRGKMGAINCAMKLVDTEITIFTDANTMLNQNALKELLRLFRDPKTGCVCGEKRVYRAQKNEAASAGEGAYWRYESKIKQAEAVLGFCVGAVGELFAIRTELFREGPKDTVLDDFFISIDIALRGYAIQYAPMAWATETASADIGEEYKRKTRIAAGNIQFLLRTPEILNFFRHGMLTCQYVSHKLLRSIVAPACFAVLLPLNVYLLPQHWPLYAVILSAQILFYLVAAFGLLMRKRRFSSSLLFIPLYICLMNIAALTGMLRYFRGRQSALWDKAERRTVDEVKEAG